MIKELTNSASNILANYEHQEKTGKLGREEAQKSAIEQIQYLRYGYDLKEYFWINDMYPRMIMHPYRPDLNGKDISNYSDPNGKYIFIEFVETVRKQGAGYVTYVWQWQDNPSKLVPKLSYVKGFKPWNWIIGTGVYIDDVNAEIGTVLHKMSFVSIGILILIMVILAFMLKKINTFILQHIHTEDALMRSKSIYMTVFESSGTALMICEEDMTITLVNSEFEKLSGYRKNEVENKMKCFQIFDKDSAETIKNNHKTRITNPELVPKEYENISIDRFGEKRDINLFVELIPGTKKSVISFIDITARKIMEKALYESEQRLDSILRTVPDIIYRLDSEGRIIFVNKAIEKYGYKTSELIGISIFDIVYPEDRERALFKINERRTGDRRTKEFEIRLLLRNKNHRTFEVRSTGIFNAPVFLIDARGLYKSEEPNEESFIGTQGIAKDITEQKERKKALQKYKKQYIELVESVNSIILQMNREGNITFVNKFAQRFFGYEKNELIGLNVIGTIVPQTESYTNRNLEEMIFDILKNPDTYANNENENIKKNGERAWIAWTNKPVYDSNGNISEVLCVGNDITGHKKAVRMLSESEELYRELFDNISSGIIVYNSVDEGKDFIISNVNKAGEKILKTAYAEIYNKSIKDVFPEIKESGILDHFQQVWKTGKPARLPLLTYRDSRISLWIEKYIFKVPSGNIITIFDDYSDKKQEENERKKLEEQLYHAQKMESIGRIAGGIAHDFNNILTSVLGYSEILKEMHNDKDSFEKKAIDMIYEGADRATKLTHQLLSFSRKEKYDTTSLNINELLKSTIKMVEKFFEKNITISYNFEKVTQLVDGDENQLYQIFANLLINAKDAMPNGGELIISSRSVYLKKGEIGIIPTLKEGNYIQINVTDTGSGIEPEILDKIFEPFFTTKEKEKGTGLGLATVYRIVKNHGGNIKVFSKAGTGTTFSIYIPESKSSIKKITENNNILYKGNGTVLIVDDEEAIREFVKNLLENLGYKVVTAKNGIDAIKIYKNECSQIDLVLLDMMMPYLPGDKTFIELKKINPHIRAFLLSGFGKDEKTTDAVQNGLIGYIQKPFNLYQLSKIIYESLHN